MAKIVVINGEMKGTEWGIDYYLNGLSTSFTKDKVLPYSEMVRIEKMEEIKSNVYVKIEFYSGLEIKTKMSLKLYEKFYVIFAEKGNNPQNIDVPILTPPKTHVSSVILTVSLLCLFLFIFLFSYGNSIKGKNDNEPQLRKRTVENADVCLAAVQYLSSSRSDRNEVRDYGTWVRINQVRASDGTRFYYECKIRGNSIIWRMSRADGIMGRWRNGPYDPEITFSVSSGGRITIYEN